MYMSSQDQLQRGAAAQHTLRHLIRKAALDPSGATVAEVPPDMTLRDIACAIAEFNEGRSMQDAHAVFEGLQPSGVGRIRITPLIP
ncbi:MAG: hypothetical protein IT406_04145 [Candidatus Yanofskybacteria bacterium]|nr:hypothetical protein [Candidatus Yanofskybacteria bacterium]